jgi:hypothetical protein
VRPALLAIGALLSLDALMLVLELMNRASGVYAPLLLLQEEANVPTWAGVAQMLGAVCAFLLTRESSPRWTRSPQHSVGCTVPEPRTRAGEVSARSWMA